jgi:hypothetical protein
MDRKTSFRLPIELLEALRAEALKQGRSVGYLVRQTLSAKFLKSPPKSRPKAGEQVVGELVEQKPAFDILWRGWARLTHKAGSGSKIKAQEAFAALVRELPPEQWVPSAELLLRVAQAEDQEKKLEADARREPIKLPQLFRWIKERRFEGTKAWQKELDRRRRSATTGATAPSGMTSTDATAGTGGPVPPGTLA